MGDLRLAVRSLTRHVSFSIVALLTLAIAIGGATAIFSVLNAVVLQPLPYGEPESLVIIRDAAPPRFPEFSVSPGRFIEWQKRSRVFEGIAAIRGANVNLTGQGDPERLRAAYVSPNYFSVMRVAPLAGRVFRADEDRTTPADLAILSEGLWRDRFGADEGIVGRRIILDDQPMTVVGITPAIATSQTQVYLLMALTPEERVRYGSHYLASYGRMKPGVTVDQARADLERASREIETIDGNQGWTVVVASLHEYSIRAVSTGLWVLSAAVGFVLLIACANVANLLLARGVGRQRELGVRAALGASRQRLARQMFVENILLGVVGAGAGVFLAWSLLAVLVANAPPTLPRASSISLDGETLVFALLLAVATPLLFGVLPALQISRADLQPLLGQGGRSGAAAMRTRTRAALIIGEVALAVMLVAGSTLLLRSFARLMDVSPGYTPAHALVVSLNLPSTRYPTRGFWQALVERAGRLPGVEHAGVSQSVPMLGDYVSPLEVPGKTPETPSDRPSANFYAVSPGYLDAMGIRLLRGRAPAFTDTVNTPRVAVISAGLAARYFPNENPLGQRVRISQGPRDEYAEVIGIAADIKQYGLDRETTLQVYEPAGQHPYFTSMNLIVRTTAAPDAMTAQIRGLVRDLDPDLPIASARTLTSIVDATVGPRRFTTTLLASFAGVALLLSAIGVYGLVSFSVGQRTQEIGVRVALGASPRLVTRMVFGQGLQLAAIGAVIGIGAGLVAAQWLQALLFEVSMRDPLAFGVAPVTLLAAAALACYWPARRALRVDPATALRPQ